MLKNRVIASRDEITAWHSDELRSNSSTLISVVTVVSVIISGSLKLFMNLVVTTPCGVGEKSAIFNFTSFVERCFTGLPRLDFRQGS